MVVSLALRQILRQPPRFDPRVVPGLKLWLEAESIGQADGSAVAAWADKSGSGLDLSQATGSKQPLLKANAGNNRPAVAFDGTDDLLTRAANPATTFTNQVGAIFLVASVNALGGGPQLYATADESAGNTDRLDLSVSATGKLTFVSRVASATYNIMAGDTTLVVGQPYVCGMFSDGAAYTMTVNGVLQVLTVTSGVNNGDWYADMAGLDNLTVGSFKAATELSPLIGSVAAVLVYDRATALTANEQRLITRGLGQKYRVPDMRV